MRWVAENAASEEVREVDLDVAKYMDYRILHVELVSTCLHWGVAPGLRD